MNLNNVLIMTGDLNIRDNNRDLLYLHHSTHADILREIADSLNLELSSSIDQISTQYMDNPQDSNLVLDLIFLHTNTEEFNNHMISLDFQSLSNHTSLSVYIIIKNSEKEKKFVNKLRNKISCINTTNIYNCEKLEEVTQEFTSIVEELWYKYSKYVNITKCSKVWWNEECNKDPTEYQTSRRRIHWIKYRKTVKIAKQIFFDNRIQEIISTNKKPWDLKN